MARPGRLTSTRLFIPTLLIVGASPALGLRCKSAAQSSGIVVRECSVAEAATQIAERHPLAVVIPNETFVLDFAEYEALCRDVRASLVPVDAEVSERELEAMIAGAIQTCLRQRERREGAGRYSIIGGAGEELLTPLSTSRPRKTVSAARPIELRLRDLSPEPANEQAPIAKRRAVVHCDLESLFADMELPSPAPRRALSQSERSTPPRSGTRPSFSLDLDTLFEELDLPGADRIAAR